MNAASEPDPLAIAARTKGFLPDDEAAALRAAAESAPAGVWLEIGTYCGKSTLHLGTVARRRGLPLVTVDHHHGSEENQAGWEWHDADLVDPVTGRLETLPGLRHALAAVFAAERHWIGRVPMPAGVSLLILARKPG